MYSSLTEFHKKIYIHIYIYIKIDKILLKIDYVTKILSELVIIINWKKKINKRERKEENIIIYRSFVWFVKRREWENLGFFFAKQICRFFHWCPSPKNHNHQGYSSNFVI